MNWLSILGAALVSIPRMIDLGEKLILSINELVAENRLRRKLEQHREALRYARDTGDTSRLESDWRNYK